jgi:hypothetical protein
VIQIRQGRVLADSTRSLHCSNEKWARNFFGETFGKAVTSEAEEGWSIVGYLMTLTRLGTLYCVESVENMNMVEDRKGSDGSGRGHVEGTTHTFIRRGWGKLCNALRFPGGKGRPGRDADHSPLSSAEVKKEDLYVFSPKCASMERNGATLCSALRLSATRPGKV